MSRRLALAVLAATGCALSVAIPGFAQASRSSGSHEQCSAGALTLAPPGSHLYPDTGNGGYISRHTTVALVYNSAANRLLPSNHVVLTDVATQCLTSFSLDFERTSANSKAGPDLKVNLVEVNGHAVSYKFVQPTYPGDPNGPNDPNPAAHEASQNNPVGGPQHNTLPPACSPELPSVSAAKDSMDGTQCPANKLVITPRRPIQNGSVFTVAVYYTGRPGVHNDGDGTTEGWFRSPDGSFVTTEPVASEDWMPLNDYPTAKPSYDFYDRVPAGKVGVANGLLVGRVRHRPTPEFPHGSVIWHWRQTAPIASYLVEDSIGNYKIRSHIVDGIKFYEVQDRRISAKQQAKNLAIMQLQPGITRFESRFSGRYPFRSDGIIIGLPQASFEEEMETMITFEGGTINTDVLYHENMHQWWGDNVTEGGYSMTFFKEGMATLAEFLYSARRAEHAAGGPHTANGRAAFQQSLVRIFKSVYGQRGGFWTTAPSNPTPYLLFNFSNTYDRPGAAYIALRQILGHGNFNQALRMLQRRYGGGNISEPQLEAAFRHWLPVHSAACQARLGQFFAQWFDTAYARGGGANRPDITGPGLAGAGFYGAGGCNL